MFAHSIKVICAYYFVRRKGTQSQFHPSL
uniref:Uncharacterized protein n=1 Tax=Arundo donax TaxID=35708 RepID=A0A0A9BZA9_ARUDO